MDDDDGGGITFTRVYASSDGETHLRMSPWTPRRWPSGPASPAAPKDRLAPVSELTFLRMDEGYVNDGHPAPRRQFVVVSAGEVE